MTMREGSDVAREITTDILVIGSGMGGSSLAWALKESGAKVLVVERGGRLPQEPENSDPFEMYVRGRYRNAELWIDGKTGREFAPGVYYYVGGNTKFFGAALPRFRESDFDEVQHAEGTSPAWPITYAELEPHYATAEKLFDVAGDGSQDPTEPPRSGPYPRSRIEHEPTIRAFAESLSADGLHPYHAAQAMRLSSPVDRAASSTSDGCPDQHGNKGDAELRALNPALESDDVSLLEGVHVTRLETSSDGTKVVAAHGLRGSEAITIRAERFVLAAGAVNSAALLLGSGSSAHPNGLANSSGLVGRNYMVHNSTFMVGIDPRRINDTKWQKTLGINDWYESGVGTPFPLGNVQMLGKLQGAMVKAARPYVPLSVLDFILKRSIDVYLTSEDLPDPKNRVRLAGDRITVDWTPNNLSAHQKLVKRTTRALKRAGYPLVLTQKMGIETNSHQCGTAVFGRDPSRSVLNTSCRTHDVTNLWITDSSFFPSSAALNPALTIAANAIRVSSDIAS